MHVEVIISTSTPKSKQAQRKARDSSPEVPLSRGLHLQRGDGSKTTSSAAERENRSPPPYPPTIKPQPVASSSRQSQPPPTRTVDESCSPQPKAPRGRKRRRVSSSPSEDEDEAPEKVIAPSRSLSVGSRKLSRRTVKPAPGYHSDAVPPTSSPVRSNDEDDAPLACDDRYRSRARSEAPIPPFPLYPPVYHPFPPRQPELSASSGPADRAESAHPPHHPYPPMAPHASHLLAWMSYFMASGALPPLPPPSHPPPAPGFHHDVPFPSHGYPSTPSRGRHHSDQSHHRTFGTPSSEAGPSHSSAYSTPAHYSHAYPSWFDPGYSSGTLPPSSPIPSSVMDSSPSLRPASVPPGQRSKSRGRRVSFKLDGNVRALSPTPSRDRQNNEESEEHYDAHASDDQHDYARGRSRSRGRRENTPMLPKNGKGKGKARAVSPSGESDDDGDEERKEPAERTVPDRGRPPPRARTPGPPSRREQSVPRGSGTTKEKGPAKKK
ncbi:hypothetical protein FKP32DRAFT_1688767 [Trametes sanguinea]|nr:hypothetical protein FKP32DRAFT_1688767 [Trametes sanguinea]